MQLSKRFFAMNVLAVVAAVVFTALAVTLFMAAYTNWFGPAAHWQALQRTVELRAWLADIKNDALMLSFDRLLDASFQQELREKVKVLGAEAVIVEQREVVFATTDLSRADLEKMLLMTNAASNGETLRLGSGDYVVARADYVRPAGGQGVLFLLAPVPGETDVFVILAFLAAGCFILSFLLMNGWVTYRFSRSVIAPVSRLKEAAQKISEGDLNGGIPEEGDGEVRELSRALEVMRIKLKESIYMQRKYDENRRFLLSSISHDLKTPVTAIIGYIEGIMDGVARTPEKQQKYLDTALAKARLVNTMIDDLLLYSKLDLKQLPFHFEKTNLEAYLADCVAEYQHEFARHQLQLNFIRENEEPVYVYLDKERFRRVMQNILDNAIKYTDRRPGRVDVVLRETATSAIVEVRDNGQGIPPEHVPRIFDRFYRADPARKTTEGSGLGLAIAKQIVESHEGKIWVTSQVGQGTRVMISLKKF